MKSKITKILTTIGVASIMLMTSSCSSLFDEPTQEGLPVTQSYKDVRDADAAVIGVYGKFMQLAKQHEILNELRADLVDVTGNSDKNLIDINNHDVKDGNPYASPRPFYEVIVNCNDVLKNFKIMLTSGRLTKDQYEQRRSDVLALRSWLYLQLGIHFGSVPYVTDAVETVTDVQNVVNIAKTPLQALIKQLITDMEQIPGATDLNSISSVYLDPYSADNPLVVSGLDSYASRLFFINKRCLLGDLYLWDNQYRKAMFQYRNAVGTEKYSGGTTWDPFETNLSATSNCYKITNTAMTSGMGTFTVGYSSGVADISQLIDNNTSGWRSIFARDRSSVGASSTTYISNDPEWLWMLPFDSKFAPQNPFIELFSPSLFGGSYLLKPSNQAIALWDAQSQRNNLPYDARKVLSCKKINGSQDYVATKHLYFYVNPATDGTLTPDAYLTSSVLRKNGRWFLNRAANVHLKMAEAANRDNRRRLAYGILNNGIAAAFPSATADVTNAQGMGDADPVYKIDARQGDIPYYRGIWRLNMGVRQRAFVTSAPVVGDSTLSIEDAIVTEGALELAFEGHRWGDLVRVALRRNDPAFLADKVYNKLKKANNPNAEAVRAKLMDPANWYLPFKM